MPETALTPFERALIDVLGEIRDELHSISGDLSLLVAGEASLPIEIVPSEQQPSSK